MNRLNSIQKLKTENFDLLVIGAGASGAGVALEAQLRGLKVALIDRGDFVSETSSKSTKLIHGGVRYLEQAFKNLDLDQLKQVRHGLAERKYLLENAPYFSKPLGIITPVFSAFEAFYYTVGLKLYGLFAKKDFLPAARWISKKETHLLAPNISKKIHSAVMYFDGQLDDARFALALTQTAHQAGSMVANYVSCEGFEFDTSEKINAVKVLDLETEKQFSISTKHVINCTGPFADNIRKMANPLEEERIVQSKGVHIVIPKHFFQSERAMLIPKTKDGRLIFVIPFQESVFIGTTDTPYHEPTLEPLLEAQEVDFLLDTVKDYLIDIPEKKDIVSGFGGLRPLITAKSRNPNETKSLLRDHEVELEPKSGLISLLGGKWTTYRLMAQDTVDTLCKIMCIEKPSVSHHHKLYGNQAALPIKPDYFDAETFDHLCSNYGSHASIILKMCEEKPNLATRLHKDLPYIEAEVIYVTEQEMARNPRDFFARRTRFELMSWDASAEAVPKVSQLMGEVLGWSKTEIDTKTTEYLKLLSEFKTKAGLS